jgi:hypothetical protein
MRFARFAVELHYRSVAIRRCLVRIARAKPDRSLAMTVEDPLNLRSNLYIAAGGAAPQMNSFAGAGLDTLAPRSQGLLAWIEGYFRHTSADRMAATSLAFWG